MAIHAHNETFYLLICAGLFYWGVSFLQQQSLVNSSNRIVLRVKLKMPHRQGLAKILEASDAVNLIFLISSMHFSTKYGLTNPWPHMVVIFNTSVSGRRFVLPQIPMACLMLWGVIFAF